MLPTEFVEKMTRLLNEDAHPFFESYQEPKSIGLRLNPLKVEKSWFEDHFPYPLAAIPHCSNGYRIEQSDAEPGKYPLHFTGAYYIQEPSAMLPAELLNPNKGDRVLDLCAAPGGKSTQLASMMENEGLLISNEIHPKRAKALSENIERFGLRNTVVTNETPERLANSFEHFFDKILVDAPCSGEGMFRKDEEAIRFWSEDHVIQCSITQKSILSHAYQMLRPGGELVYSTCTFSPEENEQVIEWFINEYTDMSIVDVHPIRGTSKGRVDWTQHLTTALEKSVRLWPHLMRGEGHFVVKLKKEDRTDWSSNVKFERGNVKEKDLKDYRTFEQKTLTRKLEGMFYLHKDHLFLLPDHCPSFDSLKVIRKGLHVGQFKKNRFEPSHHLALYLSKEDVQSSYTMRATENEWKKYMRGETLSSGEDRGWTLLFIDGLSIGWGKESKGTMKNFYPKGLRIHFK